MTQFGDPIKGMIWEDYPKGNVTQWFGENHKLYSERLGLEGHNGIDIVAPYGTPIYATTKQSVVEVKDTPEGYGRHVRCVDKEYEHVYGHLSAMNVSLGQELQLGEQLGNMGNSGFVVSGATPFWENNPYAGTHVHYGMRKFKPYPGSGTYNLQYQSGKKGTIMDYGNGYKGAVDPKPHFQTELTVEEINGELNDINLSIRSLYNRYGLSRSFFSLIDPLLKRLKVLLNLLKSIIAK